MSNAFHVVCPSCSVTNRILPGKPVEKGVCGQCKIALFQGRPVDLNSGNFNRHLVNNHIPVLVDFWAPWCGPCKMMIPVLSQAAAALEPRIRVAKLNTESERGIAAQYGIQSIPTMILFKGGKEIARLSGAMPLQSLLTWVDRHV